MGAAGGFVVLVLAAACAPQGSQPAAGRALYETYCLTCHGDLGKGDGPGAATLGKRPADLTRIAARNGGVFSLAKVMSTIDGYTRKNDHGSIMPEMGLVLKDGPTVMVDTGDGVKTPAPQPLVALAEYLRSLQGR